MTDKPTPEVNTGTPKRVTHALADLDLSFAVEHQADDPSQPVWRLVFQTDQRGKTVPIQISVENDRLVVAHLQKHENLKANEAAELLQLNARLRSAKIGFDREQGLLLVWTDLSTNVSAPALQDALGAVVVGVQEMRKAVGL